MSMNVPISKGSTHCSKDVPMSAHCFTNAPLSKEEFARTHSDNVLHLCNLEQENKYHRAFVNLKIYGLELYFSWLLCMIKTPGK